MKKIEFLYRDITKNWYSGEVTNHYIYEVDDKHQYCVDDNLNVIDEEGDRLNNEGLSTAILSFHEGVLSCQEYVQSAPKS